MTPAVRRRWRPEEIRLLRVEPGSGALLDGYASDLATWLEPGDLLVVNDAGTLPASLSARTADGAPLEVRLAAERAPGVWEAVLFGDGDWRERTEDRPAPPRLGPGSLLVFAGGLRARVVAFSKISPRLVQLRFEQDADAFWSGLFREGRPVQYSHLTGRLELWDTQTAYAARPWAVEAPSAGLPLTNGLLAELRRLGVAIAPVTHAAGLSATGDPALDAALPLPERYEVGERAVTAVVAARSRGGRVVAAGTSVVRALESATGPRGLEARSGVTRLRLGPSHRLRSVDGLLTGLHEPGTSHFELLRAFLPALALETAHAHAEARGYLGHEFGDAMLVLPERQTARRAGERHDRPQVFEGRSPQRSWMAPSGQLRLVQGLGW